MTAPRYAAPLRAIDTVEITRDGEILRVSAVKSVTASDPYLSGHFPGRPVFPGVFILEALSQTVDAALGERDGAPPALVSVRSMRFLATAGVGDKLTLDATIPLGTLDGQEFEVVGRCRRDDGVEVARITAGYRRGEPADA